MIASRFTCCLSILLWVFAFSAPVHAETPKPSASDTFRILTYNIGHPDDSTFGRFGSFVRGEASATARSEAILALLREQDADVIALQEITPTFLQELEKQSWYSQYYLVHTLTDSQLSEGHYFLLDPDGMAILSKWPMTAVDNSALNLGKLARRMLIVTLHVDGDPLRLGTCHLESGQGYSKTRVRQLDKFFKKLVPYENAILLGDFNFGDGQQPEIGALRRDFTDLWPELHPNAPGATFPSEPGQRLDRILVRSPVWKAVDIQLVGTEPVRIDAEIHYASDHYGVAATLRRTGGLMNRQPE